MDIPGTLIGRNRAMGNMDCLFTQLEEKLELQDFPSGFSSLYNSPLYESLCHSPTYEEHKGGTATCGYPAQQIFISQNRPYVSKESQIQQLITELAQLRDELQMRERNRANSPVIKIDLPVHLVSGCEAAMTKRGPPRPIHVSVGSHIASEVIAKEMEPELPYDPFEEMKTVTAQVTPNGGRELSSRDVERLGQSDYFSPRTRELVMDNRSWVPSPEETGEKDDLLGTEYDSFQTQQMDDYDEYCQHDDRVMSTDEGELQVLKAAVRKLSHIFWEQEGKSKTFKGETNKEKVDDSQTTDLQPLYLELLKGLSQQLGELCRDLHANDKPHEKLLQKFQRMEMMDQPATTTCTQSKIAEVVQQKVIDGNTSLFLKLESGAEHLLKVVEDHVYEMTLESANLRTALEAAKREIEEQKSTKLLLTEKIDSGAKYLSKLIEEHRKEIARKDQRINYAEQLNAHLANDMSQTETSLGELQSRYKGLVSSLEYQLEAARKEAVKLQDTVIELKVEVVRKEDLVSNLERETKERELLIEELRGKMQDIQGEAKANFQEKLELFKGIQAMRKEADEIHHRFKELIRLNENLIAFSESKEDEIRALTIKVKGLEQSVDEKSDQLAKMSAEALKFSEEVVEARTEGETYRLRCTILKSNLEEIEEELLAREDSIERLTQHLDKTIEGQEFLLEEKEQLLLSLNKAQYKERRMEDQVRESKTIIQDLEEKLDSMDADINVTRIEMAAMHAKGQAALASCWQSGEISCISVQSDEDAMKSSGQVSIRELLESSHLISDMLR